MKKGYPAKSMNLLAYMCLILAMICSGIPEASAKQAQLLLLPTRIVMGNSDRFVTVTVKNRGDATGAYRIELVDMVMPEKGVIREVKEGEDDKYSAKPLLRISPRKMVLAPEESQNVRIMVRKPKDLTDGEYRTHLKVTLVTDNIEEETTDKEEQNIAIAIKSRLSLIIPVIIRNGTTDYKVALDKPVLGYDNASKAPTLDMDFVRTGNRSSMGDIKVTYVAANGKETVVKDLPGVAVYRPTSRRHISLPLEVPQGVSLKGGKLHITYTAQQDEEGKLIAQTDLTL